MREVTPPVAHRTDVHPENCGDLLGLAPLQRQQNRPCPVRFTALLRFRQGAQCRLLRSISRKRRFSRHACLHSPHPRQTIHSIAHSQTVCLDPLAPGNYELRYGGTSQGIGAYVESAENVQDITYHLAVLAVPEPPTIMLLAAALLGFGMMYRRCRTA